MTILDLKTYTVREDPDGEPFTLSAASPKDAALEYVQEFLMPEMAYNDDDFTVGVESLDGLAAASFDFEIRNNIIAKINGEKQLCQEERKAIAELIDAITLIENVWQNGDLAWAVRKAIEKADYWQKELDITIEPKFP